MFFSVPLWLLTENPDVIDDQVPVPKFIAYQSKATPIMFISDETRNVLFGRASSGAVNPAGLMGTRTKSSTVYFASMQCICKYVKA